jgi:hypothetical protein
VFNLRSHPSSSNPPGILLVANIWWAESVLKPFAAVIDIELPHCPILVASKGFSRIIAPSTPQLYIEDAQPMFFPARELLRKLVSLDQGDPARYRAFCLPKICSPPLGLCRPTDIGIDALFESLKLLGHP